MSEFSGAFLGFWFNGKHSSDFGIVRTIDNRMDLNLRPESKDITMEVPGMDGSYYYGTNYTKRNFNIKFAFDAMTEEKLQGMKAWLMDKKIHELIFDEAPYKEYSAKATGVSNISHLCFEENGQRVYRGEGTIQFVCNYPFARGLFRNVQEVEAYEERTKEDADEPIDKTSKYWIAATTKNEWLTDSGLEENTNYKNNGDLPMPFKIKVNDIPGFGVIDEKTEEQKTTTVNLGYAGQVYFTVKLHSTKSGTATAIIDMKDRMIYEYNSDNKRRGILNHQIYSGDFFELLPKQVLTKNGGEVEEFKYIYY